VTWTEANRLKTEMRITEARAKRARVAAAKKERQREAGFRLVFAVSAKYRFSTNRHARRVSVGMRGDHADVSIESERTEKLRDRASRGDATWWGVSLHELLVALDAWLEAGCPRRKWKRLEARP
jgi:hypothetical protein